MIVAVGSTNPTKIRPVETIFHHHFPESKIVGVSVESGVNDQPMSQDEMFKGALNRAQTALAKVDGAEYGVGVEGGLHHYSYGWFENSLVVIVNRQGEVGVGATGGLVLPQKVITEIQGGKNLEQVFDRLFNTKSIGEGIGMFGLMTKEVVTRTKAVEQGVAFALARYLHPNLYDDES